MGLVLTFLFFFGAQALNYAVVTWNYRAVAQARYRHLFASDLVCAGIGFLLIKQVARTDSAAALAGYVLGGACGSVTATWVTKRLWGE